MMLGVTLSEFRSRAFLIAVRLAEEAGVKQLCLFHHDPSHDDNFMDMVAPDGNDARPDNHHCGSRADDITLSARQHCSSGITT
jgi:hypothetical protein